jgi:Domain of unknown function (DUF1844)
MKEEQTTFKVTDRRLFNADGSPRDIPPEEKAAPSASSDATVIGQPAAPAAAPEQTERPSNSQAQVSQTSAAREEVFDEAEIADEDDPASFINFAMSIASNAASSLGMIEHPVTHKREVDLEFAKHWIDVLGMLQAKTRGNLAAQEAHILEGLLADLRMQYVSLTSSPSKPPRAYTGRDITGGR